MKAATAALGLNRTQNGNAQKIEADTYLMVSVREPFCSVLCSQMSEPIDASREQFARQTSRPIFSLEAFRPRTSVPSLFRGDTIRRRSAIKTFWKAR